MTYNADLTWADLVTSLQNTGRNFSTSVREALNQYNEWQSFRAGRTDAAIATALGRTAAEIADMDAAFAAFKVTHDFLDNVAGPVAGDRFFALRKFT